jgi:hypothetical protein
MQRIREQGVRVGKPITSAATAKSRSRSARIWASTTRATSIHAVAATISVIETRSGVTNAASASSTKIVGKHSTASTKRISTAPTIRR